MMEEYEESGGDAVFDAREINLSKEEIKEIAKMERESGLKRQRKAAMDKHK